jgi:hypothetical protein
MVKVLQKDYKNEDNWTDAEYVNMDELHDFPIYFGGSERLGPSFPQPVIRLCRAKPPVDFFQVGSMTIISSALRKECERAGVDAEYFEIELQKRRGGIQDGKFYFVHLLCEVDCFDFEQSDYDTYESGLINKVRTIVLRHEAIEREPVFTMKNAYLGFWLASDEFAAQIESAELRGLIFIGLDEVKF